jgi:hypothetical protein
MCKRFIIKEKEESQEESISITGAIQLIIDYLGVEFVKVPYFDGYDLYKLKKISKRRKK